MTFVSYGYALPEHDSLIECYRNQSLGDLTKEVVKVAKSYPDYQESVAGLIAKTAGKLCLSNA
jgi:hypothetical protein